MVASGPGGQQGASRMYRTDDAARETRGSYRRVADVADDTLRRSGPCPGLVQSAVVIHKVTAGVVFASPQLRTRF